MIQRDAEAALRQFARGFRAVLVNGPRQSGKTTLARQVFPDKPYALLEELDTRRFAIDDPRGFLAQFPDGAILDEVHKAPALLSYLQGILDTSGRRGQYILTGSCNFRLLESMSQSLAGRVGQFELLPLSWPEIARGPAVPATLDEALFRGGYPEVHDESLDAERWYNAYVGTYVERDIRQLINLRDLMTFQKFLGLCAANCSQLLNANRIGADCGVHHNTVASWLSLLQATYVVFVLPPHLANFRKRLVKSHKLYFHDTGLACRLLGIDSPKQLARHPLRGALFENWVVSEMLKARCNRGKKPNLFFWRNSAGLEIDVIADQGGRLLPIEIKSGATVASDWFANLEKWQELAGDIADPGVLVYGGEQPQERSAVTVLPWRKLGTLEP